jgi:hypothetical protein
MRHLRTVEQVVIDGTAPMTSSSHAVRVQGTRFSATAFLIYKKSDELWSTFLLVWVLVYLGAPCILTFDQGIVSTAELFRENCKSMGIRMVVASVESHSSIGLVERFHAPIRRMYQKLGSEARNASKELRLAMATKAVNDTIGLHGYVPTMLVYGARPSILMDKSCAHQLQRVRMRVLAAAIQRAEADFARRRLREAENHMIPNCDYEISPGDAVSVWRDGKGWVGPPSVLRSRSRNFFCPTCYGDEHPRGGFLRTRDTTSVVRNMHGSFLVHSESFTFNRTLLPT